MHESTEIVDELRTEYDFSSKKGVRGKYYRAYQQGQPVRQLQEDGSVVTQYFTLEDGAVMLAPDVREYFATSKSVNQALRGLIDLIPHRASRRKHQEPAKAGADSFIFLHRPTKFGQSYNAHRLPLPG